MKVKMILPALKEAVSPGYRPIKYSLFPPLGLATLAAYLDEGDEVAIPLCRDVGDGTAIHRPIFQFPSVAEESGKLFHRSTTLYTGVVVDAHAIA